MGYGSLGVRVLKKALVIENVKLESVNECGILVCDANQVQFKSVVITEMR